MLTRIIPPGAGSPWLGLAPSVVSGLLAGAAVVAQAALLSRVVDAAFLAGATVQTLVPALAVLAALALLRALCGWFQETAAQHASAGVRAAVRDRALRRVLAVGPRLGSGERTGELTNTLLGGVEALDAYVAQYLPLSALAALVPALVLVAVASADALSALLLVLTFPLVPLFLWLIGEAARASTRRQWITLSRLSARFFDALNGLPTLRAFGRVEAEAATLEQAGESYRVVTLRVLRLAFVSALVLEALATLGTALVAVEVGLRVLYGRMAFRQALFVLLLAPEFYRPLRALGTAFHAGMAGREAAQRLATLVELPGPFAAPALLGSASRVPPVAAGPGARAPGLPPHVRFEDVRFTYPGRLAPALDGFTLDVPAGATVALVGPSGSGKTTAAHLLLHFLQPDAGALRVDGVALAGTSPEQWRARVAWVPQRPRLLEGTLRDNLLLARPDAGEEALARALGLARLDAVVARLPLGLDTPAGAAGERLSGGEAQRLALARAFLKDAPLLVLDEPTAQLDPDSEDAVVEAIARLRRGRTVFLIAHRLTTAAAADRVAIVSGGRVIEHGLPAELAADGRIYPQLLVASQGAS